MPPPDDKPENKGRLQKYRENLLEKLVLTLPVGLISAACAALQTRITRSPLTMIALAVPLVLSAWLTWRLLQRPGTRRTLLIALAFLTAYGAVFALASVSDVLVWRQVPNDQHGVQLRPWMLPVRAGDWRYAIAQRRAAPADDMVVVLMDRPPGDDAKARLRAREASLVRLATEAGARGVGFDVYFEGKSAADDELCGAVLRARTAGIPVWAGYTNKNLLNGKLPVRTDQGGPACFPPANLGSLIGFADSDGRVRAVRLTWARMQDQPSFSVLGANALVASYGKPALQAEDDDHVLRFLPPPQDVPMLRELDVIADPGVLQKRLVLIGLNVPADRFHTPFGVLPGTQIQANAIHSLRVNASIERPDGIWSGVLVAVLCYLIVVLAISGMPARKLLLVVAGLSVAVVLAAAILMRWWLLWFEVIYPLVAMWLLVPLVLVARRKLSWLTPKAIAA